MRRPVLAILLTVHSRTIVADPPPIGHTSPMHEQILVVSHGPHCLDGVVAAASVARFFDGDADVSVRFSSNSEIDGTLRAIRPERPRETQLWITDISWREPETDAHLRMLVRD